MKNRRSIRFKLLTAIILLLILICAVLTGTLIFREHQRTEESFCLNKACVEATFRLQQNMDVSENPCDNFYRFACGGWEKRNVIPEENDGFDTFNFVRESLVITLKNVLEQPEARDDIPTTRLSKRFYRSCMNHLSNKQSAVQTLREVAAAVGGLPIVSFNYNPDSRELEEIYSFAPLYRAFIKNPFSFSYSVDVKHSSKYILQFDQPSSLGLPSFDMYKNQQKYFVEMSAYKTLLSKYLHLLQDDFKVTLRNITGIVDDFIAFETIIAKASVTSRMRRNHLDVLNITTLEILERLFPQFKWENYINRVFNKAEVPIALTKDARINLASYSFFSEVDNSIFVEDAKRAVSYMHLFSTLTGAIRYLPKKYRKVYFDFTEFVFDTKVEKPRYKECHDLTNGLLNHAVGRMLIDASFSEDAKNETVHMIKMIVKAFGKLIEKNVWMDEETKLAAANKLNLIRNRIGYPDWTKDDAKLAEYYKDLYLKKDAFIINNLLAMYKWSSTQYFARYDKPIDKNEWITSAAIVNAFYSVPYNSISFPAGILQPPFFHKDYPRYLNFGAIGVIIGHEITHGFDDQGNEFDGNGNMHRWWSEGVVEKFEAQAKCLTNQYEKFEVPYDLKLNGFQTQTENIADNSGVKQSFQAYREWVHRFGKEELKLPGLNFTPNQLFF